MLSVRITAARPTNSWPLRRLGHADECHNSSYGRGQIDATSIHLGIPLLIELSHYEALALRILQHGMPAMNETNLTQPRSLCESCLHLREVISGKGSRFLMCRLSQTDHRFQKYPPQPIVGCSGHKPAEEAERS